MQVIENDYTETSLEENEVLAASVFSQLQLAHIRNQIAAYAKERAVLAIDYNASEPERAYILAQQKLLGSIEALQYLLALHTSALTRLQDLINNREPN